MAQSPTVELIAGFLQVTFPYSPEHVKAVKDIGYARWVPSSKSWVLPNSDNNLAALKKLFPSLVMGPVLRGDNKVEAENLVEAELRKYIPAQRKVKITDFAFKTEPLWHQAVSFNFARALDQSAIFLEQGLGKTKIAIDLATWRFRKGQVKRVLYVAPNSVVPQWETQDVLRHVHDDFSQVTILSGSTKDRIKTLDKVLAEDRQGYLVANFEALIGLEAYLVKAQGSDSKLFQMMVLDESSKIKHAASQRSKASWRIGRTVQYRNIMTGTPITQSAEDAFSQFRFLKASIFGPYATAFRGNYMILGGFENRQVIGYRNITEFFEKLFSVGIRFTKSMAIDLPSKVYQVRTARMDEDTSRRYEKLEKDCIAEFSGHTISTPLVLTKMTKLAQICGGFVYEQNAAGELVATHATKTNPKADALEEILDEVLPNKVIVWCRFRKEVEVILAVLEKRVAAAKKSGKKFGVAAIHGGIPQAERGKQVTKFQEDPACYVFVGTVPTAGLGITLTAASYVVYYSNDYSLENRLQSEDRCHRIGQKKSVTYIDLLATRHNGKATVDQDIREVVMDKSAFANEVSKALVSRMMGREKVAATVTVVPAKKSESSAAFVEPGEEF